ncbi:hypothetical protein D3C72_2532810 [compost metagenome]
MIYYQKIVKKKFTQQWKSLTQNIIQVFLITLKNHLQLRIGMIQHILLFLKVIF